MSAPRFAIGVDIGGGSAKIGVVSSDGRILNTARLTNEAGAGGSGIVQSYVGAIKSLMISNSDCTIIGVGIGYPGIIHPDGRSGGLGNVPGLIDYPLAAAIEEATGLPCVVQNDANAAALAEAIFGDGKTSQRLLMVTAGTGIGLGFVANGKPVATSGGGLGDAGHMILDPNSGKRCRLGCRGCLEALASGEALNQVAAAFVCDFPDSKIGQNAIRKGRPADASDIVECAIGGDESAVAILAGAGCWIGRAVASWIHIFAPSTVMIGGGLAIAGDALLAPLEGEARRCGLADYLKDVTFIPASLGNEAGIVGAAAPIFRA
ncbi:ROK family protein [Rhizobium sp. BE258]|uniref:ROK family protein n=1 Tax=Rhizobium sp. BE258 TaxID=2817722 RepID=UPI0028661BB4|nr:ROK family protein [Rhizobium sp. BE258]MDR7144757.1 glucokinase [Rhizobium sp. BE258]